MSSQDWLNFKLASDSLGFFDKYTPPYIVYGKTVRFFQIFRRQKIFRFDEIKSIDVKVKHTRTGLQYQLLISTLMGIKKVQLARNIFQLHNLIKAISEGNPSVKVSSAGKTT